MKTRLLLLALLAAPIAARAELSPTDLAFIKVTQQSAGWHDWALRSAEMESAYVNDAIKSSDDVTIKNLSDVDKIEAGAERKTREWRDSRVAQWNAQAAAGTITTDEAERRAGFADRLFNLRMLWIYGNIMPRVIDSCAHGEDDQTEARLLAGPWGIAATNQEFKLAEAELIRIADFPPGDAYSPSAPGAARF